MKTLQHINRTQSRHSNPIKIRANADVLHSLNSMNITENPAEPMEYDYAGPFVRVQCACSFDTMGSRLVWWA